MTKNILSKEFLGVQRDEQKLNVKRTFDAKQITSGLPPNCVLSAEGKPSQD